MDPSGKYDTARAHAVIKKPGFYETMPAMRGAVDARVLDAEPDIDLCICTAPFGTGTVAAQCEEEKRLWVKSHLGEEWLSPQKFICVKDKSTVKGLLLIDDKPEPRNHWRFNGSEPTWRHVVFTQPFNQNDPACDGKPRLDDWSMWRDVLIPLL